MELRTPKLTGILKSLAIATAIMALYSVLFVLGVIPHYLVIGVGYATYTGCLLGAFGLVPGQCLKSTLIFFTVTVVPPSIALFMMR